MGPPEVEAQCDELLSKKNYLGLMELWKNQILPDAAREAAEVESEWYKALFEEDCLRIMKLLKVDPRLVKVGWESEPSRIVEGSPGSHWKPKEQSPWKGRTALHVSARRGCIELVKQVLELYDLEIPDPSDQKESERVDRQVRNVASSSGDSDKNGRNDLSSSHDTDRKGKNACGSSHDTYKESKKNAGSSCDDGAVSYPGSSHAIAGKRKELVSLSHDDAASGRDQELAGECTQRAQNAGSIEGSLGTGVGGALSPMARGNVQVEDGKQEKTKLALAHWTKAVKASDENWARRAVAGWKRNFVKGAESHRQENAGAFDSLKHDSFAARLGEDVSKDDHDRNTETTVDVSSSCKDLLELLVSKDGIYEIDALAIATIHFNSNLVNLLVYAIGQCGTNPYDIRKRNTVPPQVSGGYDSPQDSDGVDSPQDSDGFDSPQDSDGDDSPQRDSRDRLRQASKEVLEGLDAGDSKSVLEEYSIHHRDFNFFPAESLEYLFHFSFTTSGDSLIRYGQWYAKSGNAKEEFRKRLWAKVRWSGDSLWRFVLEFQDGQGRTPGHVAVEERVHPDNYLDIFHDEDDNDRKEVCTCFFTGSDGAGRTLLDRAAGTYIRPWGFVYVMSQGLGYDAVRTAFNIGWEHSMTKTVAMSLSNVGNLSEINGFRKSQALHVDMPSCPSPFHSTIIRKASTDGVLGFMFDWGDVHDASYNDQFPLLDKGFTQLNVHVVKLDALGVACLVEDNFELVGTILKNGYLARSNSFESGISRERRWVKHPYQVLHIVAALGNYKLLKMFLDHPQCDPFVEDFVGNTALHYALTEPFDSIEPSLLHYVSCQDLLSHRPQKVQKDILGENAILERQGCVTLLLQAGCEIFKDNHRSQVPHPQGSLSNSVKFRSWWYDKQEKEFGAITNNLRTATNAISVTATLVATASYVGPLQPPLSYAPDPINHVNQIQYENVWVATFLFCDTFSFYLAIIAIVLSLIPSLPMPQQAMVDELRRTKSMMVMAVAILIPSIICVLIAFAASSVAVVSANIISSVGGKLTISTLCICGPFFLASISLFLIRLLGILSPRTPWIRDLYKLTSC